MWPYVYQEFMNGIIYTVDGHKFSKKVNIHVRKSTLQYIDGENIKETINDDILFVTIGNDQYMPVSGKIMKVVGSKEKGFVATLILADFSSIHATGGAYGSSSNSSSTMKLSSIEIGGETKTNHMDLKNNKESGVTLNLVYSYYIVTNSNIYEATRKGIETKLPQERKVHFKAYLKSHNIQWKVPASLLPLIDFLNEK
ncbi:MAG: hypothetical protein RR555_10965 [Bacteroidales bacterium]